MPSKHYEKYKEQIKARSKARYWANKEKIRIQNHERYLKNKDRVYKKTREWVKNNPDKAKAYKLAYRERHKKEILTKQSQKRKITGRSKDNERRRGTDRSKEKMARRARVNNRLFLFTNSDWEETLLAFDNRCAYCRRKLKLTRDHYIPISNPSGDTIPGNIVPACLSCNSSKIDKSPMYWVGEKFGLDRLDEIVEILSVIRNRHYREVTSAQFKHLGIERSMLR